MLATALLIALAGVAPLDEDQAVSTAESSSPPVAAAPQEVDPAQRGVIAYPPAFFAAAQPRTALDMKPTPTMISDRASQKMFRYSGSRSFTSSLY